MITDRARFWSKKAKNNDYFCVLTNFLDKYTPTKEEIKKKDDKGLNDFFELYDDDDIKYYSGYANFDLMYDNNMDEFTILNMATCDSGCTYIKTRNKAGKMEIV